MSSVNHVGLAGHLALQVFDLFGRPGHGKIAAHPLIAQFFACPDFLVSFIVSFFSLSISLKICRVQRYEIAETITPYNVWICRGYNVVK